MRINALYTPLLVIFLCLSIYVQADRTNTIYVIRTENQSHKAADDTGKAIGEIIELFFKGLQTLKENRILYCKEHGINIKKLEFKQHRSLILPLIGVSIGTVVSLKTQFPQNIWCPNPANRFMLVDALVGPWMGALTAIVINEIVFKDHYQKRFCEFLTGFITPSVINILAGLCALVHLQSLRT